MKRFAALMTALLFLVCTPALAFTGQGYPAWDGVSPADNSFNAAFGDERISLAFDPSEDYSNIMDGLVQVCFFAYDATESSFLEVFLLIPEDVAAGDVLQNGDARSCSVCLYETSLTNETFYFADDLEAHDSTGASMQMTIESVERIGSVLYMSGSLRARLCRYEFEQPTSDFLAVSDAHFSFALPADANPFASMPDSDGGSAFPELPDSDFPFPPSAPAFTLPPDYVTI